MGREQVRIKKCKACKDELPLTLFTRVKREPLCFRCFNIYKRYKLNHYDISTMLTRQKYKCAVCGGVIKNSTLCVDHCHDKKHVRGLLCHRCNLGLGQFNDNKKILQSAIKYLTKHGKSNTKKS